MGTRFIRKSAAIGLLFALVGCAGQNAGREPTSEAQQAGNGIDRRLVDTRVTNGDLLLRQGDAGLEFASSNAAANGTGGVRALGEPVKAYPNPAIAPYQGGYAENVVSAAAMYFGTPYEYGSDRADPSTFDCSDFTRWAFLSALGMDLPKDSRSQARYVEAFSGRSYRDIGQARRGDLLFFVGYRGSNPESYPEAEKTIDRISHTGIYLGNGKMIHTASVRTGGVRIDDVFGNHLQWRFVLGGSVLE